MDRIPYMEIIMRLKISSHFLSSSQMTMKLGLIPDRAWDIGDFRPKTRYKEKINGIIIESGIERKGSIEEHIESITAKIHPIQEKILNLSEKCQITLSTVYYSSYCCPALWFDNSFVKLLASINAEIEMSGYVLDTETDK